MLPRIAEGRPAWSHRRTSARAVHQSGVPRAALKNRERIRAGELRHPIFQAGTSHAADPTLPGQPGTCRPRALPPIFASWITHRFCGGLSRRSLATPRARLDRSGPRRGRGPGEISSPDVGRHTGVGNGGLLLIDCGRVAVRRTPGAAGRAPANSASRPPGTPGRRKRPPRRSRAPLQTWRRGAAVPGE